MINAVLKIAPPYREGDVAAIKEGFERMLGCEICFEVVEDSSLIGGFCAFIGGKVYENSYASRLRGIKDEIKK